jgi:uncharacterized phage-associated protein
MVGMFDLSKTVCQMSGWNLTHLKLQKVLYILQMYHLGRHDSPLFFGSFEAWDYGPVEPNLYQKLSGFGNSPLPGWAFLEHKIIATNHEDFEFINEILDVVLRRHVSFLVAFTHDELGAWSRIYEKGKMHTPITNEDIRAEYERRFREA